MNDVERELRDWLEAALRDSYRAMFFSAASILRNQADAQEVTQQAALKATRAILKLAHLPPEERAAELPRRPRAWLVMIARNAARDLLRRSSYAEERDGSMGWVPDAERPEPVVQAELRGRLLQAIGELPEKQALTLTLYYDHLRSDPTRRPSPSELADELGVSPNTVSKRVYDAMASLRKALGDSWQDWRAS